MHQWKWDETLSYTCADQPNAVFHPKTESMGILKEEVTQISGSVCRASFITKSNKIGTLCDSSMEDFAKFIEHKATAYNELSGFNISQNGQLHTCSQWTILQVKNDVYWWGIIPYEQRVKAMEKLKKHGSGKREELTVGSMVVMKKQPVYRAGTKAVKLLDNEPRIGEVTQDIHKIEDSKVEFKIIYSGHNDERPDKTDESVSRKRQYDQMVKGAIETEKWNLKRVIFLPEVGKDEVLGKIARIDGNICAVNFGDPKSQSDEIDSNSIMSKNMRFLLKEDLCLWSKSTRLVEITQWKPKKITLSTGAKVIAADIDEEGFVHLITHTQSSKKAQPDRVRPIQYGTFDIGKNEMTHSVTLPTTAQSFQVKETGPILDHTFGDCPVILLDALKVHHPLFFNASRILQDPEWFWLGLPPIRTLSSSLYYPPSFDAQKKEKAFVALVVFKRQILSQTLLENIPELVKVLLQVLTEKYAEFEPLVEGIYEEIVDGQRNIIHTCIDGSKKRKKSDPLIDINHSILQLVDAVEAIYDSDMAQNLHTILLAKLTEKAQRTTVIRKPMDSNSLKYLPQFWHSSIHTDPTDPMALELPGEFFSASTSTATATEPTARPTESTMAILLNSSIIGHQLYNLLKWKVQ